MISNWILVTLTQISAVVKFCFVEFLTAFMYTSTVKSHHKCTSYMLKYVECLFCAYQQCTLNCMFWLNKQCHLLILSSLSYLYLQFTISILLGSLGTILSIHILNIWPISSHSNDNYFISLLLKITFYVITLFMFFRFYLFFVVVVVVVVF